MTRHQPIDYGIETRIARVVVDPPPRHWSYSIVLWFLVPLLVALRVKWLKKLERFGVREIEENE